MGAASWCRLWKYVDLLSTTLKVVLAGNVLFNSTIWHQWDSSRDNPGDCVLWNSTDYRSHSASIFFRDGRHHHSQIELEAIEVPAASRSRQFSHEEHSSSERPNEGGYILRAVHADDLRCARRVPDFPSWGVSHSQECLARWDLLVNCQEEWDY
jgi:hypothetical protein